MFGFGTAPELATPIGQQVKAATDSLRLIPDWTVNLQICDQINRRRGDTADQALRAIRKRLSDSEPQTVYLALMLMDTCMKNCGTEFAAIVDRTAIEDVATVARNSRGVKNADEALRLIATWGRAYESRRSSFPVFFDTYMTMKSRGFTFPIIEESALRDYMPSNAGSSPPSMSPTQTVNIPTEPSTAPITAPNEDEFVKLQLDLAVVMEKVRLCREILLVSPGIKQDDALADVIGFLEACRDRMVDVIEAGSQGMLGEELFALALKVNDAVLRTLDAERTGTKINVDEEENPTAGKAGGASTDNLLDLNTPKSPVKKAAVNDDFMFDLDMPTAVGKPSGAPAPAPKPAPTAVGFAADPFGDMFDAPKPPPAPASAAASVNPFDEPAGAAPPATAVAAPAAASAPASGGVKAGAVPDEFDLFLASTSAPAPSTAAATTSSNALPGGGADPEFDAFLASLEKK
jgi:hypothetical protein